MVLDSASTTSIRASLERRASSGEDSTDPDSAPSCLMLTLVMGVRTSSSSGSEPRWLLGREDGLMRGDVDRPRRLIGVEHRGSSESTREGGGVHRIRTADDVEEGTSDWKVKIKIRVVGSGAHRTSAGQKFIQSSSHNP